MLPSANLPPESAAKWVLRLLLRSTHLDNELRPESVSKGRCDLSVDTQRRDQTNQSTGPQSNTRATKKKAIKIRLPHEDCAIQECPLPSSTPRKRN